MISLNREDHDGANFSFEHLNSHPVGHILFVDDHAFLGNEPLHFRIVMIVFPRKITFLFVALSPLGPVIDYIHYFSVLFVKCIEDHIVNSQELACFLEILIVIRLAVAYVGHHLCDDLLLFYLKLKSISLSLVLVGTDYPVIEFR